MGRPSQPRHRASRSPASGHGFDPRPAGRGYRRAVARVSVGLDFPFGYTVTIWSAGALAPHDVAAPHPLDVAAFVAGAVLVYLALGAFAHAELGSESRRGAERSGVVLLDAVPVFTVGLVALLDWIVRDPVAGWFLFGAVATAAYVLSLAVLLAWQSSRRDGRRAATAGPP